MGNPHAIITVKDLGETQFEVLGKEIEIHPAFPSKTNVHFLEVINFENLKLLVWERGAGPTMACGTGACATLVAAKMLGLSSNKANVELPGGTLKINWPTNNSDVFFAYGYTFLISLSILLYFFFDLLFLPRTLTRFIGIDSFSK